MASPPRDVRPAAGAPPSATDTRASGTERPLGDIVSEVTQRASLLVREEVELAKAELQIKAKRLAVGAAVGAVAGVFALFTLIYFLHGLAYLLQDLFFGNNVWAGYFVVTVILLLIGGVAAVVALRSIRRGTPPTPEMAIEEARQTRGMLEQARR